MQSYNQGKTPSTFDIQDSIGAIEEGFLTLQEAEEAIARRYADEDVRAVPRYVLEVGYDEAFKETLSAQEVAWERKQKVLETIGPCPFCGVKGMYSRDGRWHHIGCLNQECSIQPSAAFSLGMTVEEVVQSWNTRK